MQKHLDTIIQRIEEQFNITEKTQWLSNGKYLLKQLQSSIEQKVKGKIVTDPNIAKAFIDKTEIANFLDLPEDRRPKALETLISKNKAERPYIDERTLSEFLLRNKYPSHQRIRNSLSIFVYDLPFQDSFFLTNNQNQGMAGKMQPDKLQWFENTHWWVYYFHYNDRQRRGKLGRATLSIKDKDHVFLQNIDSEIATHYEGCMQLENSNQHLSFDLYAIKTNEKHLRITVFTGIGKVFPLLLGVYSNIYAANAMAAGTIMLHRIRNFEEVRFEAEVFEFEEALASGIHEAIIRFFRKREQNFIKTPGNIITMDKMEDWLDLQSKR